MLGFTRIKEVEKKTLETQRKKPKIIRQILMRALLERRSYLALSTVHTRLIAYWTYYRSLQKFLLWQFDDF